MKSTLIALCLCLFGIQLFAQLPLNQFDLKKKLPSSPEAAMIGRFGDIPIGYYTGTADISIPLYTIKDHGMEIPVTLRYHASGIKVDENGTNVGLGWSLEPGGSIIHVVNGVPDHLDNLATSDVAGYNFLMQNAPVSGVTVSRHQIGTEVFNGDCFNPAPITPGDNFTTTSSVLRGEGQPDIYHFSMPGGHSGKFYLHPVTLEPIQLNKKEELKIERLNWEVFKITTLDGNIFIFDIHETSTGGAIPEFAGRTYKLSQIQLPNGRTIDYTYANGYYNWRTFNQTYHSQYPLSIGFPEETRIQSQSDNSVHHTKYITRIAANEVFVDFKYEDREDLITVPDDDGDPSNGTLKSKRIKSIEIISRLTGLKIKSYNLGYDYFGYSPGGFGYHTFYGTPQDKNGKRLKLTTVQEVGYDATGQATIQVPPYQFGYDESALMPMKTSYARDFWGYYNGQNGNNTLLPDMSYFYWDGTHIFMSEEILFMNEKANRAVNKQTMGLYMLNKIQYPTGGFTTFEYEPHSFTKVNYPDQSKLDTTRRVLEAMDQNESNNTKSVRFSIPYQYKLKLLLTVSSGSSLQGLNFYHVSPSTISIYKYNGGVKSLVQTWQLSTSQEAEFNLHRGLTWEVTYPGGHSADSLELAVELPDGLGPQNDFNKGAVVRVAAFIHEMARLREPKISYGAGMRVKGIKSFTDAGKLASHKVIRYVNADSSLSGKLMSPLQYTNDINMHFEIKGSLPGLILGEARRITFISAESIIPFSDGAGGALVGYSRVEELNYDGQGNYNGRKIFNYRNEESITGHNTPDQPDYRNGLLSREEIRDAANNLLSSTDYIHARKELRINTGIKAKKNYILAYDCTDVASAMFKPTGYLYQYYPLRTEWYVLETKETKEIRGGNNLSMLEKYTYNANGLVTEHETRNSKDEIIRNNFVFHTEAPYTNEGQLLRIAGLQNTEIEKVTRKVVNNVPSELSRTYTQYKKVQEVVVPAAVQTSINGLPLETEVIFNTYGTEGTLQEVTQRGNLSSLLWSDRNLYPMAAVQNAAKNQIAFTSFEDNVKGQWNYNVAGITSAQSFTGGKSFNLSPTYPISSNGLIGGDYMITYRSRNATPFAINGTTGPVINGGTVNGWTFFQHKVTNQGAYNITGTGIIDDIKLFPVSSALTTYVVKPGVGVIASTDPRGTTSFYEYDAQNRLKIIRDQDGNILRTFDYQYNINP